MNYSISAANCGNLDAYEIKCYSNRLGDVFDYFKENHNKRCNIILKDNEISDYFYEQIDFIKATAKEYTIAVTRFEILKRLIKEGYNAYLAYPVSDWETFNNLKNLGVTDIIIDGALGFQMSSIAQAKGDIKIRVTPMLSSNAALSLPDSPNENSFFIRPEDLKYYEDYIDIIEFQAETATQEKTYFEIYNRGFYDYDLTLLIRSLHTKVPNPFIIKDFAPRRLNCRQKCQDPAGYCVLCSNAFKIANELYNVLKNNN